jgi:hypothetical protein
MPEGSIPLIDLQGAAYDCGRQYAEIVLQRYPGYRLNLDCTWYWRDLPAAEKKLVEQRAPHLLDLYRGLSDVAGPPQSDPAKPPPARPREGCTSFSLSGAATLDGCPISGQTRDTPPDRVNRYIVLRLQITGAPSILAVGYPGEVMCCGFWTTGMSLFRNALYSAPSSTTGMHYTLMTILMLACHSVDEVIELVTKYGRRDKGNTLLSDSAGRSVSIETNAGGQGLIREIDGVNVHANHPLDQIGRAHV